MRSGLRCFVLVVVFGAGCTSWPGGIHAVLRYRASERALWVERVPAGGAAARAGLQPFDRILAIDGIPVDTLTESEIRARLRGEVGTQVRLRIRRNGNERDVVIERAPYR